VFVTPEHEPSSELHVCPACGFRALPDARFCSSCGQRLDGAPSPRHVFGVLAPGPTLVLGCLLLVGAILTLVAGSAVAAIVLGILSAATFVLFAGAVSRDPDSSVGRLVLTVVRRVRGWAIFGRESAEAWARATREVARLGRESRSLRRERKRRMAALGEAAYREDAVALDALCARLHEIDDALATRDRARRHSLANARRRVHDEHVAVQPTQRFTVDELAGGDPNGPG
jgi:hypothetical protein